MRRALAVPALLTAAAVTGAVVTVAVRGGAAAPAAAAPPPPSTATVVRTNLATTVLTEGTLGYAPTLPIVNAVTGTYTWLPAVGSRIRPGRALYRVDNLPVVLMRGGTPAWRPFAPGMTDGPDVRELQASLIALGYAAGLLTAPTGQFDLATLYAVERWQLANGYPETGQVDLGQVVFLPSAILVGAQNAAAGQAATPGQQPYQATTDQRTVTVPLNPDLPSVHVGEAISIVLPSNATTPGTAVSIGPAPSAPGSGSSSDGSNGNSTGTASTRATDVLTVRPGRPGATGTGDSVPVQVSLATQSVSGVLAVPVTALLALAGGGYGVEIVTGPGADRLVGVQTGIFAAGEVAITGPGIAAGTKVVVAQ
ncbi:MAG TPA: peptidoglycan-binding domain-containing protein [Streptosporangiaceae bacterium]|nr:peptidoglycan-binding domain-containing protein [Streptosporangiaceae bacterium]